MSAPNKSENLPPSPAHSLCFSSDEDSFFSDDEPKLSAIQECSDEREEEEEEEEEEEPDPDCKSGPKKPSEEASREFSDKDGGEEEKEKPKSTVRVSESKPKKTKRRLLVTKQSSSKKLSVIHRIWSLMDEMALVDALSAYHARNGDLPVWKDYASFLSEISGSIGFSVTVQQLVSKIRALKNKINKGSAANSSHPHEKVVFEKCNILFESTKMTPMKKARVSARTANRGVADGDAGVRSEASYFYLKGLIRDVIKTQHCSGWFFEVDDIIAQIGESSARDLDVKVKSVRIDTFRLCAREEKLKAELLSALTEEMADD